MLRPTERELPVVYLKAGEMHFTDSPTLVITLLGSCLSVTMFSRRKGLGGICHGLLPQCGGRKQCDNKCLEGFKYVECSIRKMGELFDRHGAKRSEIEVKVFGGADMFSRQITTRGTVSVGQQNIQIAEKIIVSEGLTTLKTDVGGMRGRKIFFYTDTGEVFLKRLAKADQA